MKKAITLHPSMGQHIINHLSNLAPLPNSGVLAGQAVASAIMDLYARGGGVYNDLDIFQPLETAAELEAFEAAKTTKHSVGTVCFARPDFGWDRYERLWFVTKTDAYKVLSSRKEGMVNTILYDLYHYRPGLRSKAAHLISCFDLNCTRVAVDLASKQLSWTPEFQYFINTYQLQVTALQTPFHTAIRFANKLRQMPVYGDVSVSMELIVAAHNRLSAFSGVDIDRAAWVRSRFGRVHAGAFEQNASVLAPYFELEAQDHGVFTLQPHGQPEEKMESMFSRDDANGSILFGAGRVYQSRLKSSKLIQARKAWIEPIVEEKFRTHGLMSASLKLQGDAYLEGEVSHAHMPRIVSVTRVHVALQTLLVGMTLNQQFEVVKRLKRFEKVEGPWVYGLAETAATMPDVLTDEAFQALIDYERENFRTPLVEAAFPENLQLGPLKITELLKRVDLYEEGSDLKHCVGGYATMILQGCRIFSIRTGPSTADRSTLLIQRGARLGLRHAGEFVKGQHKSYANGPTTSRQDLAATYTEMKLNGFIKESDASLSGWRQMLSDYRQLNAELKRRKVAEEERTRQQTLDLEEMAF